MEIWHVVDYLVLCCLALGTVVVLTTMRGRLRIGSVIAAIGLAGQIIARIVGSSLLSYVSLGVALVGFVVMARATRATRARP
jgi:hypothetical protein